MNEVWKTVIMDGVEYPRYQVSNFGRVKTSNWNQTKKEKICSLSPTSEGYLRVRIGYKGKSVHRLVAEAFLPNPQNKPFIDHIDCNRQNNIVEVDENGIPVENSSITNLRWCTQKENVNNPNTLKRMSENAGKSCLGKFGADHPNAIPIVQLTLDGQFLKKWSCATEAARELGISRGNLVMCLLGKRNKAGGYRWMYYDDWLKVCKSEAV
jgi:hypothetical protein